MTARGEMMGLAERLAEQFDKLALDEMSKADRSGQGWVDFDCLAVDRALAHLERATALRALTDEGAAS